MLQHDLSEKLSQIRQFFTSLLDYPLLDFLIWYRVEYINQEHYFIFEQLKHEDILFTWFEDCQHEAMNAMDHRDQQIDQPFLALLIADG